MAEQKRKIDTIRLQNLSYGHKQAATLMAAVELDLFTFVSRGFDRLSALAEATGLNMLNTERLVTSCTALNLLEKYGNRYLNAEDVERFLVKDKASYIGPWLLFNGLDFEKWKDLAKYLKSDNQAKVLGLYETLNDEMARVYHEATYSVGLGAGMLFARDVDMSGRSMVLDLGGGSGAYCIASVQKYPNLKAVVLDFESVCKIADEFIAQWGLQESIKTHPGDFTNDPFPDGADVMIMASNLPQYDGETLEKVLLKAFNALAPAGEFHLVGETLDNEKQGPLGPALWGLHEALFESKGRSHSEAEVVGYLENAGFVDVQVHTFVPGSLSRIAGRKM